MDNQELALITNEFKNSKDYRIFILKYHDIKDPRVKHLIAKASWHQINLISEVEQYRADVALFIKKYKNSEFDSIKILAFQAMFVYLKKSESIFSHFELNEFCNQIIEYAEEFDINNQKVHQVLMYVYWIKAEHVKGKDIFKAQYFYKKILSYSKDSDYEENYYYYLRVRLVLMMLDIRQKKFVETDFYHLLDKAQEYGYVQLQHQVLEMLNTYIDVEINPKRHIDDQDQLALFLHYIEGNEQLKVLLISRYNDTLEFRLPIKIAYLYWILDKDKKEEYSEFLYAYYLYFDDVEDVIESLRGEFYFFSPEKEQKFSRLVEDGFKKYKSLNKYRQLFKVQREGLY